MGNETILEARNINKYFREPVLFHVLKDINFKVKNGEFVSIMGKSGCGKSTLLYILSTMDTFTVLENVMLPAKKLGIKSLEEIEHDAIEKLKLLDIDDQANKLASRISGGQKQRVAIARALINDPSIIMGDEPTGNLDSHNAQNVLTVFKDLVQERNLSLLIVTHDSDFAKQTDRVIEMGDGHVISQ